MTILIITVLAALAISFFCSLMEACLLSLSHTDMAEIGFKDKKAARIIKDFKKNIQKPIAVVLIINTIAHTTGASLSGAQFEGLFGAEWIMVFSLVFSFAMIQWTEILPKTLGVKWNRPIARFLSRPLKVMIIIFTPIVKFIEILNAPFMGKNKSTDHTDALEELTILSRFAAMDKLISKDQADIISRTVNLSNLKIKEIMVPEHEMKTLNTKMNMMDALLEAHVHNHTRYPLLDENKEVKGYINFKDIVSALQINPQNPTLTGIVRPVIYVNENNSFSQVFKKLLLSHQHIAIVQNNQKKTTGLITQEDLMEEIVGDIEDEYDTLPVHFYQLTEHRFIAGGGLTVNAVNEKIGLLLPGGELTMSDAIIKDYGVKIRPSDLFLWNGVHIIIKKISRSRISEVIIEKIPEK